MPPALPASALALALATMLMVPGNQRGQDAGGQMPPITGTSAVHGRVVDAITGRAVKGAIVTVDGEVRLDRPSVLTSADGAFTFQDLPAGSLSLTASKPGYFDGAYGQRRASGSRTPLMVDEGEQKTAVVLRLWPHGWIGGVVADESGRPLGGVTVRIVRLRASGDAFGSVEPVVDRTAVTDDRGAYNVPGLLPGRYVVGVVPQYGTRARVAAAAARTNPFSDLTMTLDAEGRREITIFGVPLAPPDGTGRLRVYPATFATSAVTADDAEIVTLDGGEAEERVNIDLRAVRAAQIAGVIAGPDGPAGDVQLRLIASASDHRWITASTTSGADGSFLFAIVPHGRYLLEATRMKPGAPVAKADPLGLFAEMPVLVDRDLTGANALRVALTAGATVRGRFVFEGEYPAEARWRPMPFLDPVAGAGVTPAVPPGVPVRDSSEVRAEDFVLTGVPPGLYLAGAVNLPAGWMVTSVTSGGREILGAPLTVGVGGLSDLVVTVSNRVSSITGVVRGTTGASTDTASVGIFPADRALWVSGTRGEHRLRTLRAIGEFTFESVPPGDYFVAAVDDARMGEWPRAEFLAFLMPRAVRVTVRPGEVTRVGTGLFSTDSAGSGTGLASTAAGTGRTSAAGAGPVLSVSTARPPRRAWPGGAGRRGLSPQAPNLWKTDPSLSGTVTDDTGAPVPGVLVTVADAAGSTRLMAVTNEAGQFAFGNLPAGQYGVRAARPGYISASYGADGPDGPPALIPLAAGEARTNLVLRLIRAASVTGRVLDEDASPLPGVIARVYRTTRTSAGTLTLAAVGNAVAGRDGSFRIGGLPPGEYMVGATHPGPRDLRRQDGRGNEQAVLLLESYHSNAQRASDARAIALGPGDSREGVDVTIRPTPASRVTGLVSVPTSQPLLQLQIELREAGPSGTARYRGSPTPDGRFTVGAVPAGQYELIVRAAANRGGATKEPAFFIGSTPVSTDGVSPVDVTVTLIPASRVTGRAAFSPTTTPAPDPRRPLLLALRAIPGSSPFAADSVAFATFSEADSWTITWADVGPGRYVLSSHEVAGWQLITATIGGREVLDVPFDVRSGVDVTGVSLTFTDARTELTGAIRLPSGQPNLPTTESLSVLVFSKDRQHWWNGSRRTQLAKPGPTGGFTLRGLPPGEYLVAVLSSQPSRESLHDVAFLESLSSSALPVTLAAGQRQNIEVVIRVPRP